MIRQVDMVLDYQEVISGPPIAPKKLYETACQNDGVTIDSWRQHWIDNTKANHAFARSFKDNGIGSLFRKFYQRPVIVAGSGPSLKNSLLYSCVHCSGLPFQAETHEAVVAHYSTAHKDLLAQNVVPASTSIRDTKGIPIVSCLHNFHFFEDAGVSVEAYVSLDAGEVVLEEIAEGGKKTADEYWAITKDRTLLAFIGSHPKLAEKWQGKILWFNAPIPDPSLGKEMDDVETFRSYVSNGGNVLGACFYTAKAVMGANPVIFIGADFSFSYTHKFHGWDSKYDKSLGQVMKATDVFGNRVLTWPSYWGFKCWFDSRCVSVPGLYINASEGGIFGAYPEGNIAQVIQLPLKNVIRQYSLCEDVGEQYQNPATDTRVVLF